jgi:predicted RNA-binding Zn ribbon-like protein
MGVFEHMNETDLDGGWDFEAGRLPLDFANTTAWHASAQPQEMLKDYSTLVVWSRDADLLTEHEVQYLLAEAKDQPSETSTVLAKAIELRETLYRIFSAVANDKEAKRTDLSFLNVALTEALKQTRIISTSSGFEWSWADGEETFDRMLWPIVRAAANLLTSEDLNRIGECADDRGCGWLFLDTSRNSSRRWCSMDSCGNRAKARRHYRRQTQKQTE